MSLLEDVRQLAQTGIGTHCDACTGSPISGHFEGCPLLSMPKLVKVVEVAERLKAAWEMPSSSVPIPGSMGGFDVDWERGRKRYEAEQEARAALVAALNAESS